MIEYVKQNFPDQTFHCTLIESAVMLLDIPGAYEPPKVAKEHATYAVCWVP